MARRKKSSPLTGVWREDIGYYSFRIEDVGGGIYKKTFHKDPPSYLEGEEETRAYITRFEKMGYKHDPRSS